MVTRISLCMIVRNEEQNIARCLQSVQGFVDEIIVIDTGSTDKTVEIARRFGAKVYSFLWNGNFSAARNASLEFAIGEWILFLDADEALTTGGAAILRQVTADGSDIEGFFIKIINYVGHGNDPECCPDMVFRLFRNRPDYRFHDSIHEQIIDTIQQRNPQAKIEVAAELVILHYGYLDQQIKAKDKINRNLSMLTQEVKDHPESISSHYHYGVELIRSGQYEAAVPEFLCVTQKLEPGAFYLPKVLRYLVVAYRGAGKVKEALATVKIGVARFPDYADLYYYGGLLSYEERDYGIAYTFFEQCLSRPEQPIHYASHSGMRGFRPCFYLGKLAEKFGNEEEALRYYIQGLRDNPSFLPMLENITRIIRPWEDPAYARNALEKLCDFCSPQSYLAMGQILLSQGAFGLALEYLRQGTAEQQEPSLTGLHQAVCWLQKERYLEALLLLDLFHPGDSLYPLATLNKLLCFWFQGNGCQVRRLADELLALELTRDTRAVISLLRNIPGKDGPCPVKLGVEGMILLLEILLRTLDLGRWEYGKELLKQLDRTCLIDYGLTVAQLWERYGRLDEADYYVRLYLDAHPDSADAHGELAGLLRQRGLYLESIVCYRQAIDLDPREPQYYCKLIELYTQMSRTEQTEAVERLAAAVAAGGGGR